MYVAFCWSQESPTKFKKSSCVSCFIQRAKNGSSVPHIVRKKFMFYLATEPFQAFFSISEKASGKHTSIWLEVWKEKKFDFLLYHAVEFCFFLLVLFLSLRNFQPHVYSRRFSLNQSITNAWAERPGYESLNNSLNCKSAVLNFWQCCVQEEKKKLCRKRYDIPKTASCHVCGKTSRLPAVLFVVRPVDSQLSCLW
jgi:hypothetical protein